MNESVSESLKALVPLKFRPALRAIYKRIYYFGLKYKCNYCNSNLRTFLPSGFSFPVLKEKKVVGGGYRQNTLCPVCGTVDRGRLLYLFLVNKTDIFEKPKKLLHVAPEVCLPDILQSKANIDYLTADICQKSVMIEMDITDIQFPDESFDAIICNHVLEHIIDDGKAMSELYRTLKPGGWAILQVPLSLTLKNTYEDASITTEAAREQAFGQNDHVRIYAADYKDRLTHTGFTVEVFKWVDEAENFGGRRNLFGLNEDESVFFVSKPR